MRLLTSQQPRGKFHGAPVGNFVSTRRLAHALPRIAVRQSPDRGFLAANPSMPLHLLRALRRIRITLGIAGALLGLSSIARSQDALGIDPSPHSAIELLAERPGIAAGGSVTVAVRVTLDAGWHTYWVNGGDAGLPISVVWSLPPGITAGPLRFPTPSLLPQPPLMSYGYEREVLYLVELHADRSVPVGSAERIQVEAEWLACADVCLPAAGAATLELPVVSTAAEDALHAARAFRAARDRMPTEDPAMRASAWGTATGYLVLVTGVRSPNGGGVRPYLFADSVGVVDHAAPQYIVWRGDTLVMDIARPPFASGPVKRVGGVLALASDGEVRPALLVEMPLRDARPSSAGRRAALAMLASTPRDSSGGAREATKVVGATPLVPEVSRAGSDPSGSLGLLAALLLAFLGGVLLNLMPCVFPILSVKVLSFVQHGAGESRQTVRHALTFAAGVLVTLWTMVGALLALRAGGASLGWGFQLQSPLVVAALALLMFGLALNLSGTFEVGVSLTRLGGVGAGNRVSDSFLTGALAVVVATPCTAPFMGAAIGFALVQPPVAAFTVFTSLALGLALPYVVLASVPALLRRLPRPGAWLETFKQALAFPMYATVVWLLWVFGQQTGIDALAVLLLALTLLALAAWAWGRASRSGSHLLRVLAAGALLLALGGVWRGSRSQEVAAPTPSTGSPTRSSIASSAATELVWETFSPEAVSSYRAAGRPVFVDFTAAWCLSCQVNERVALQVDRVRAKFIEANVVLLRADWTSRDSVIAKVLASHGRSGVPLYVLYPASPVASPEILPTILTPGIVMAALDRARS